MQAFIRLITSQPQLLVDHAEAYADLLATEVRNISGAWKRRALLNIVALACMMAALIFAGVAIMLWAVVPQSQIQAPWALIATPLLPFVMAIACLLMAKRPSENNAFVAVREQLKADRVMLREMNA
jgi:uncharacterized membrane protein YqjE